MNSDMINGLFMNRRSAFKALAGATALAAASCTQAASPDLSQTRSDFDYDDPYDNL